MLRKSRHVTKGKCAWGCCHDGLTSRQERRLGRRRENREWRRDA